MAQKLRAEAGAEMRAFDEAGHIGDDKGLLVRLLADGNEIPQGSTIFEARPLRPEELVEPASATRAEASGKAEAAE